MNALLALLLLAAARDQRKPVDVVCPADGTKFTAYDVLHADEWGGKDADFCPHAIKTTPLEWRVWTCPGCRYSGLKKDFERKLTDEEKSKLRAAALKPAAPVAAAAKQAGIPGHVKGDLYAQTLTALGASPADVGGAWLRASWCARQQGAVYLSDFDEWETLRTGYSLNQTPFQLGTKNRTDLELEAAKKIAKEVQAGKYERGVNRTLSRYLAAFLTRRHGENAEAEKWLAELEKLRGENSVVDDAAAKMKASIELERGYQAKALAQYAAEFERGKLDRRSLAGTAYIAGELCRRLGEAKKAVEWFQKAIEMTDSPEMKKLAAQQKDRAEGK